MSEDRTIRCPVCNMPISVAMAPGEHGRIIRNQRVETCADRLPKKKEEKP